MQCIRPIKASFNNEGDLVFNTRLASKELVPFAFPCRKCLPCRLNIAREKAIRCWHESKMYEENIFLTLTYDEEHLESPKLIYKHWQKFIQDLRDFESKDLPERKTIPYIVTGEYGEENKRPHWHAILFNYQPSDAKHERDTENGEKVYSSRIITNIWNNGKSEFGSVTLDSAGYVARYAAKKLVHGKDQDHDFHPIHRTSSKYAIGKSWIEKNYRHTFSNGFIVLPNGSQCKIPRYYEDWFKKEHPAKWREYATNLKLDLQKQAEEKMRKEELNYITAIINAGYGPTPITKSKVQETILKQKFKKLQEHLKL